MKYRTSEFLRCVVIRLTLTVTLMIASSTSAWACGGFFCQNTPISQAGEQIVFRQEGSTIKAMVRILYTGEAEEFSWVVPVPTRPLLSVGADSTFAELDVQTRPQFLLERTGQECRAEFSTGGSTDGNSGAEAPTADDSDGGVIVENSVVGPYDAQILSSDDAAELANWLSDNGYDLTDRGLELIAPYVEAGMTFVALKLRSGESSGSIQPLIMEYQSEKPMIPIKLTAIAAQDDMGVLVWVVADARAVPENYLHVIPNYTRVNWYRGSFNAYASYQSLITAAMDEAGGQGFATDFAGPIDNAIAARLTSGSAIEEQLLQLDQIGNDAEFVSRAIFVAQPFGPLQAYLQTLLPLPGGFDNNTYFDAFAMTGAFTAEQLAQARVAVRQFIVDTNVEPRNNSVALLPEGAYLTRMYTTLSADEMTLDPVFAYNTAMPGQPVTRNATLASRCGDAGTEWTLTLGAGTGRDGEVVIRAGSQIPFNAPVEVNTQRSVFQAASTSGNAAPVLINANDFDTLLVGSAIDRTPVVTGNTITWPDNGWYQVQRVDNDDPVEVCAGGRSCVVDAGNYVVINHTTGERFENIDVASSASSSPVVVEGNRIVLDNNDWWEVQRASDFQAVCEGVAFCDVLAGTYNVINHSTQQRFEGVAVPSEGGPVVAESSVTVQENTISWSNNGWYQVQSAADYTSICDGGSSCTVAAGTYIVINHDTGERFEDIVVGSASNASASSQ